MKEQEKLLCEKSTGIIKKCYFVFLVCKHSQKPEYMNSTLIAVALLTFHTSKLMLFYVIFR